MHLKKSPSTLGHRPNLCHRPFPKSQTPSYPQIYKAPVPSHLHKSILNLPMISKDPTQKPKSIKTQFKVFNASKRKETSKTTHLPSSFRPNPLPQSQNSPENPVLKCSHKKIPSNLNHTNGINLPNLITLKISRKRSRLKMINLLKKEKNYQQNKAIISKRCKLKNKNLYGLLKPKKLTT